MFSGDPYIKLLLTTILAAGCLNGTGLAQAQEPVPSALRIEAREKRSKLPEGLSGFEKSRIITRWAPPNPYGKFVAMDKAFKHGVDWQSILAKTDRNINPNELSDTKFIIPLLVGARMSDVIVAVKTRDIRRLNEASKDVEALAKKIGIEESELKYARELREKALSEEWMEVYTKLSILQHRIDRRFRDTDPLTSALVMTGAWMRGATYLGKGVQQLGNTTGSIGGDVPQGATKAVISAKVGGIHPSYYFREPEILFYLADEMARHAARNPARSVQLKEIETRLDEIGCIVSIAPDPPKGRISPADMDRLLKSAQLVLDMGYANK